MSDNTEYSFQFYGSDVFVKIEDKWRWVHRNSDIIQQNWRMRSEQYGDKKPKEKKIYKMKIPPGFKLTECHDADCPINGCKYCACYWVDYVPVEMRAITH